MRELDLPPLGSGTPTCVLVTKTLVFAGDGAELFFRGPGDPIFRAYDKTTGAVVGSLRVPAPIRGCPMTYQHHGRQFIVFPVAAAEHPQLIALALGDVP